jgi:hypothetical protein
MGWAHGVRAWWQTVPTVDRFQHGCAVCGGGGAVPRLPGPGVQAGQLAAGGGAAADRGSRGAAAAWMRGLRRVRCPSGGSRGRLSRAAPGRSLRLAGVADAEAAVLAQRPGLVGCDESADDQFPSPAGLAGPPGAEPAVGAAAGAVRPVHQHDLGEQQRLSVPAGRPAGRARGRCCPRWRRAVSQASARPRRRSGCGPRPVRGRAPSAGREPGTCW